VSVQDGCAEVHPRLEGIHYLEQALLKLQHAKNLAGRSEEGRHLAIVVTDLEGVLLRARFFDKLPK
jgi:hypothetical protein